MQEMAATFGAAKASTVAVIDPVAVAPWTAPVKTVIKDRDEALDDASTPRPQTVDIFSDASIRNGKVGIGLFSAHHIQLSETVAQAGTATVLMAELAAIWLAATLASARVEDQGAQARIFTDSKAALRAIAWPRRSQNQELVAAIYRVVSCKTISIHWVPGHADSHGNEEANRLAQNATTEEKMTPQTGGKVPLSILRSEARRLAIRPAYDSFLASTTGQFTKKIDKALPGKHTITLYNRCTYKEAAILSQLRTGRARINKYLSKIGAAASDSRAVRALPASRVCSTSAVYMQKVGASSHRYANRAW
jgi:ribonuclease HI